MIPTAVLDACVLYPAPLRDLLLELAYRGEIRGRWTAEIHDEWTRNLRADRPDLDPKRLVRTCQRKDRIRDCLVTGHMSLVPGLALPDPDDRHVLAAASHCGAGVIVTRNLKDFPDPYLDGFGIVAQHPDEFLMSLAEARPDAVVLAASTIRQRLKNPPATVVE